MLDLANNYNKALEDEDKMTPEQVYMIFPWFLVVLLGILIVNVEDWTMNNTGLYSGIAVALWPWSPH